MNAREFADHIKPAIWLGDRSPNMTIRFSLSNTNFFSSLEVFAHQSRSHFLPSSTFGYFALIGQYVIADLAGQRGLE